jgi:geranylgeranyl reductase family protein
MSSYDIVIVGGGPAGSAAAITAARAGARVLLLERGHWPRQKVCGEFISAEGVETLRQLDASVADLLLAGAPRIGRSRIFVDGQCLEVPIEPEAASVTRWRLDLALWNAAKHAGAECREQTNVTNIAHAGDELTVTCTAEGGCATQIMGSAVIDASGRWSRLRANAGETLLRHSPQDRLLQQPARRQRYVGLKAHFQTAEVGVPTVDLYFFPGGYCGVQPIGGGRVNACAMVRADVASSMDQVLALHPVLAERSRDWRQAGEAVATSPLVFEKPRPVRGRVLCAGDAAGFVDPFVGDGITLALRGGCLAAEAALHHDARWYAREYRRRLGPVFGHASWLRRVMALPGVLRRPIVATLRAPIVGRLVVNSTRAH